MLADRSSEIPFDRRRSTLAPRAFVNLRRLHQVAFAAAALLLCSNCAELEQGLNGRTAAHSSDNLKTALAAPQPEPAYWNDVESNGTPKIVVKLGEQRALFYKGGKVVGESNISTGRKGFETPPGKYRVIQKDEKHVSNLYGSYVDEAGLIVQENVDVDKDPMPEGAQFAGAPMDYFLRFTLGYGMHAGFVPRYRASHGCIRMPREMARHFFDAADMDTPVQVME